jgi:hypothetical protein
VLQVGHHIIKIIKTGKINMNQIIENALDAFAQLQKTEEGRKIIREKLIKPWIELMESEPKIYALIKEDLSTKSGIKRALVQYSERVKIVLMKEHPPYDKWESYGVIKKWLLKILKQERWVSPYVEIIVGLSSIEPEDASKIHYYVYERMPAGVSFKINFFPV